MSAEKTKTILIVGGGFAGIKSALELQSDHNFKVKLLTQYPDFRYYPTLYRTATGGVKKQSSIPLETIFGNKPVEIVVAKVTKLDREKKQISTEDGQTHGYDILILALGVITNFFNIKGLEEYAYGIKSIDEAEKLKAHLHKQLTDDHHPDLNYVIIGGGPTGIELAGQMPDYLRHVMMKHGIKHRAIHIELVEAAPRLLPRSPKDASRAVSRRLRRLGIKLFLGQTVQAETADSLMVNGRGIKSHTVIWTAGVTNNPFFKDNGFSLNDRGKVLVDEYLKTDKNIYVLGDNADTKYSGMAQTALFDAVFVSRNIKRLEAGKEPEKYQPKEPITVLPVGSKWAAVIAGHIRLYGWIGWVLRELADLKAFHDFEPWWIASNQFMKEFETEEDCPVCALSTNK
jgi:NADH dehydrogenase